MTMGKKKKSNNRKGGNRFFRWMRSDLPDEEDKKSPVLLLGVNKITDSPSFVRRRSIEPHTTGSIRFFRPPKSKYTRGLQGDERLEKIRQDLLVHKHTNKPDKYIPKDRDISLESEEKKCLRLNCAGNCICDGKKRSSDRGSFSFHRPENRQSSLCPSEPYGKSEGPKDFSENDIEFKYREHIPNSQPSSSKQSSYNITPKSAERRHFLLANLNERFRKTLSLDSRKIETNRVPLSLPKESRPKSLVNTSNICVQHFKTGDPFVTSNFDKASQPKKKRKSFFSLDAFFDSKKSDTSSVDDYCSSKYKRFELESDDSPLFRRDKSPRNGQKTPDLLNLPIIIDSVRKKQSDTKRQLEKLESHYYKSLIKSRTVIDAVPKDATDIQGPSGHANHLFNDDDDVEYIEPIRSNFTSQSTLILDKNIPGDLTLKPDSILTINTDETDIKLPSSTVSPKSHEERIDNDLDSIGAYEIEVKEADLLKDFSKDLTVKIMDKSVDSIGSCSLDVDASTDFSDTTSGSLNLLTPSSTTSRIRDFTSRIQERASNQPPLLTPVATPTRALDDATPTPKKSENLLKPPPKVQVDAASHRSRAHHKKRDEVTHKKPSYLNLACSVNGYTNLTTYDSKLRQDINKSREASPIRPITHGYPCRTENNSLLVPVPVSANKLLVPNFGPHDTRTDLTAKAPSKAHTDPYLATSPLHVYMAAENKQLKNDFLGPSMTTASRPYISNESKNFAASMLHQKDEVDNAKELTFKSSYSETNFRKTVTTNGKESRFVSSESYTISSNGMSKRVEITKENGEKLTSPMKSFIQQRVERLYGPGALAQGFFNQKRHKLKSQSDDDEPKVLTEKSMNCPNDRFVTPRKSESFESENMYSSPNGELDVSLPVLRHLRPEFRAQLPILSPKKSIKPELSPQKPENIPIPEKTEETASDVVTNGVSVINLDDSKADEPVISVSETVNGVNGEKNNGVVDVVKDGHYFLDLEKKETERLLALSVTAEKELENLQNQDISEEVLGLLRSASGKARLLATQKMQQFEGLCYNNINERLDEPFPTTVEDLQGFWDMVCLQVKNVDALYEHIAMLKANNWQEILTPPRAPASSTGAPLAARARRVAPAANNERARRAAEKRESDRKAMLEHRRRVARERQQASRAAPGCSNELQQMGIEGSQEVEIFVGKSAKPSKVAPTGDCRSTNRSEDSIDQS
ncbi:LOW QUALITY PROTEIN: disks large-associated protein 2 [Aphomia sociella]